MEKERIADFLDLLGIDPKDEKQKRELAFELLGIRSRLARFLFEKLLDDNCF